MYFNASNGVGFPARGRPSRQTPKRTGSATRRADSNHSSPVDASRITALQKIKPQERAEFDDSMRLSGQSANLGRALDADLNMLERLPSNDVPADQAHTDSGLVLRSLRHPEKPLSKPYSAAAFKAQSITVPSHFMFSELLPALKARLHDDSLCKNIVKNAFKKYRNTLFSNAENNDVQCVSKKSAATVTKLQSQLDKGALRIGLSFLIQEALTNKFFFRTKNIPEDYRNALEAKIEQLLKADHAGDIVLAIPMMTRKPSGNSPIKCRAHRADLGDALTVFRMAKLAGVINKIIDQRNQELMKDGQASQCIGKRFKVRMIADINRYHGIFNTPDDHVAEFQADIKKLANTLSDDVDVVLYDSVAEEIRAEHPEKYQTHQKIYTEKLQLHQRAISTSVAEILNSAPQPFQNHLSRLALENKQLSVLASSMLFSINFDVINKAAVLLDLDIDDAKDLIVRAAVDPKLLQVHCDSIKVTDAVRQALEGYIRTIQIQTLKGACTYLAAYQANSQKDGIDDIATYMGGQGFLRGSIHKKDLSKFDEKNIQVTLNPSTENIGLVSWHSSAALTTHKKDQLKPRIGLASAYETRQMKPIVEAESGRVICYMEAAAGKALQDNPQAVLRRLVL